MPGSLARHRKHCINTARPCPLRGAQTIEEAATRAVSDSPVRPYLQSMVGTSRENRLCLAEEIIVGFTGEIISELKFM